MNPPFSGAQDVKHVEYVLSIVPDRGGPRHHVRAVKDNTSRIYTGFRTLLDAFGIKPEDPPAGTFKDLVLKLKAASFGYLAAAKLRSRHKCRCFKPYRVLYLEGRAPAY